MNLFVKTNDKTMSLGDFQRNNYKATMNEDDISRDALITGLFDSSYYSDIIENKSINKIALIGVIGGVENLGSSAEMKVALEFEKKHLNSFKQEDIIKRLPYFWKNQVPIFGAITNNLINYSKF